MRLAEIDQRLHQAKVHGQLADRGGFTAGDDQPIQAVEVAGQPHLHRLHA